MDIEAVRTFVAVVDTGRFQDAAAELSVTQQGVSKRIATLEKVLGVRLFTRAMAPRQPTPHAHRTPRPPHIGFRSWITC